MKKSGQTSETRIGWHLFDKSKNLKQSNGIDILIGHASELCSCGRVENGSKHYWLMTHGKSQKYEATMFWVWNDWKVSDE